MRRRLVEAINVPEAVHIGTAHGYDVFDILSFSAAQQFRVENRDDRAGSAYTQNENVFNANINDSQHLYFFAEENTNKVYGAAVKGNNTRSNVTFIGEQGTSINILCNFMFENAGENSSKTYYDRPLPFFLIPGASFEGQSEDISCFYVDNLGTLIAALAQFYESEQDELLVLDNMSIEVITISSKAFDFGVEVDVIKLGDHIQVLPAHCMDKVHNRILVTALEAPSNWDPDWNAGKENITTYGFGMDPETIAQLEQERAAAAEAEQQRQAEAQRQAEEEARRKAEREARKIRYQVVGKEIKIIGTLPGISELRIPPEIEGKPVTTIGAYAFFGNEDLKYIKLPSTLRRIEAGAFAESQLFGLIYVPYGCIIGKNVVFDTSAYIKASNDPEHFT